MISRGSEEGNRILADRGLRPWLDQQELVPGRPWQEALEKIIQTTKTAAVILGPEGAGPWEKQEIRAVLSEFVKRQLPVIPVLLHGARKRDLPLFLQAFTWVELREGLTKEGLDLLEWGITGTSAAEPFDVSILTNCEISIYNASRRPMRSFSFNLPELSEAECRDAVMVVAAWKRVHTFTEQLYHGFREIHISLLRWLTICPSWSLHLAIGTISGSMTACTTRKSTMDSLT